MIKSAHQEGWINMDHMDHMDGARRKRVRMECAFGHLTVASGAEEERLHNYSPHRFGMPCDEAVRIVNGDVRSDLPIVSRRPRARWPELVVGRERLASA